MIIPTHCQTCGEVIGHLWEPYTELYQKYAKEASEGKADKKMPSPEYRARQDLIAKYGLDGRRLCCLYSLMVTQDISDMIQ